MISKSELFLHAAEVLDALPPDVAVRGACWAISEAAGGYCAPGENYALAVAAQAELDDVFAEGAYRAGWRRIYWGMTFADDGADIPNRNRQAQECRVLMLLFLSAMAADEEAGQ